MEFNPWRTTYPYQFRKPKGSRTNENNVEVNKVSLKGTKMFFCEYKDVFTWSYQDMKGENMKKRANQCVDIL
jgi:hypothetical protein